MKLLLILPLLLLAGCYDEKQEVSYDDLGEASYGGTVVSASGGQADNLVPWLTGSQPSHKIAALIYDSILTYDKNLNLKGELAEKWHVSDDGLTLTFTLKKNIQWQDGTPLTTQDVLATFKAVTAPTTRTPYAGDFQMVKKLEIVDAYTFRAHYAQPFVPALSSWTAFTVLPAHVIETEEDFNKTSLIDTPLGNGPYTLRTRNVATLHTLKSNPHYHSKPPYIENYRIRVIPDQDTQFLELKAAKIDTMSLTPVQYTRLTNKDAFTNRYEKYDYLGNGYTYLGFNLKHPILGQKVIRQALSYATPRQDIIKGVLFGQGVPITGPFKPGTWAYNTTLTPIPFNMQKAKQMLAEDGWTDSNKNGVLDKEIDGKREELSFTIVTNQGNAQRIKTAEILQYYWRKLGVEVNIQVQEWSTFLTQTINKRQFEAFILGWSLTPEPDPYDIWHSSKTKEQEFNIISFNNPRADVLMEQARRTFNQAERKTLLDEFQEILHEEQPYLFLYAPYTLVTVHKRIKGIEPAPAGLSHNMPEWYIPENQRLYKTMQP